MTLDLNAIRAITDTPAHRRELAAIDESARQYGEAVVDFIDDVWAEARAKSQAAHPSRVAARLAATRNEYEATLDATRAEADRLRESLAPLADVIDLDSKRGGRA